MTEDDDSLASLVRRIRLGDEDAAAELVRVYEAAIRRVVRLRMRDPRLRRAFDASDICQSVLASFFARLTLGQYDLDRPGQLVRLLETMARNKIATEARRLPTTVALAAVRPDEEPAAPGPGPVRLAVGHDLVRAFRDRMTDAERWLSDERGRGRPWAEIAAEAGEHPDAVRKRLARALDRISHTLGLGDDPFA